MTECEIRELEEKYNKIKNIKNQICDCKSGIRNIETMGFFRLQFHSINGIYSDILGLDVDDIKHLTQVALLILQTKLEALQKALDDV